jgi:hypothetical protein
MKTLSTLSQELISVTPMSFPNPPISKNKNLYPGYRFEFKIKCYDCDGLFTYYSVYPIKFKLKTNSIFSYSVNNIAGNDTGKIIKNRSFINFWSKDVCICNACERNRKLNKILK